MARAPSPTFDISDDERTGPRQTGGLGAGDEHRRKSDHPPAYDQARNDHKKAEKELKRKTEQLADAKREQQRREKQPRGGGPAASSVSVDEEVVGELRESAEGGREMLARERQELTAVEGAISEMRGRLAHFAQENAEFERERRQRHEQAVEEQMAEQRRLRAKAKQIAAAAGGGGSFGGGGGSRLLALPPPTAAAVAAAAAAAASGPPAVDASGWLALVINLQRRADRLAAVSHHRPLPRGTACRS